ncbi:phage major capsid protein [Roseicitreum antarcticum]|uniref:phage major capsid protein n=1 Tax=Roseicitreum antarcticum TaxID=564137 RepID=UPI001680DCBF|nr:hypothetical protein [Roseicitreum antarcticum]
MVNGPARDYMALSLPEMAAMSAGQRGRVQRGAGELRAIEMAFGSHSVSDFPAIFENALNKRLSQAYQSAQPTYRAIAERIDMSDFRPTPIAAIGDWPTLMPIGEGGEIKSGTVGDKSEIVALAAYGRKFHISRQMMVNDDLGAIDRLLSTRGRAVAAFEDQLFYAMLLAGAGSDGPTLRETGRQVFNASDKTKAASAAAITPAAVAKGFEAMMQRKGVGKDDPFLAITPSILLVGPQQLFAAQQLVAPIQAAQADNVNPMSARCRSSLRPISPATGGTCWLIPAARRCSCMATCRARKARACAWMNLSASRALAIRLNSISPAARPTIAAATRTRAGNPTSLTR